MYAVLFTGPKPEPPGRGAADRRRAAAAGAPRRPGRAAAPTRAAGRCRDRGRRLLPGPVDLAEGGAARRRPGVWSSARPASARRGGRVRGVRATGVGRVFEEYASGRNCADDEVAMVFDQDTLRALSEPLVNLRFAVAAAVEAGAASAGMADRFLRIAKELYFPDRRTSSVLTLLRREPGTDSVACDRFAAYLTGTAPNAKCEDAIALIEAMRGALAEPAAEAQYSRAA